MRLSNIKIALIVLLVTLIYSCDKKAGENFEKLNLEIIPERISGEVLEFEELVTPTSMIYNHPFLFLKDSKSKNYIHVIDLPKKEYVNNFGQKGKGPGEMLSVASLDVLGNSLWLHDLTLGKLVSYNLDSIKSSNVNFDQEIILKGDAKQDNFPRWLSENELVSITFSDSQNRLIFTDSKGEVVKEGFKMFSPPSDNIPYTIHNESYQGVVKVKPDTKKVVVATRYSDLIEIYDLEKASSKRIKTHSDYSPIYEVMVVDGYTRLGQDGTMRFGYLDIAVDDEFIYTIYSGRTRAEGKANYGDTIIIFDWKGKYIKSYTLENRAIAIEVVNGNQLFALERVKGKLLLKKYDI